MTEEQILLAACEFVDNLSSDYERNDIRTWGIAFTTYEDELEDKYGEENLLNIKKTIYELLD